jgi:hypothetical protein
MSSADAPTTLVIRNKVKMIMETLQGLMVYPEFLMMFSRVLKNVINAGKTR